MKSNIRLISASAGTGKTYRLTGDFSQLLIEDKIEPSQIIATTFTRAAAGELKNRIREKILEHGLFEVIPQLDQALVGTVNSVSQQLLSLFSFERGLSPALTVIDDTEKDVLFQTALSGSLDVKMWDDLDKIGERFSMERKDIMKIIKSISDNARNNALDKKQLEISRDDSISSIKKVLPKTNKNQQRIKSELNKNLRGLRSKVEKARDGGQDTANALQSFETFSYKVQQEYDIPWAEWASCAKLKCNAPARDCKVFDEVKELMQAHLHFPEFHNDIIEFIRLCFDAAIISMQAYSELKKERGLVDFVDQESLLLTALDDVKIKKRFQQQFKILFVDEFQDTSPLQLALFLKISSMVKKVIWVGDAKQSIYGFRNSDAELIKTVTTALGKPNDNDILKTSYRSRPELVDIVNRLFLPAFQKDNKEVTKEEIIVEPDRGTNKDFKTAFQLWGFKWQPSKGERDNKEKYQSHLAARVIAFLENAPLVEDIYSKKIRVATPGDISILCRTNDNCTNIANALRTQGLQAVVSNTGLNLTAEWRLLKACLHLLVDNTDSLSKFEIDFLTSHKHDVSKMLEERLLFLKDVGKDYERQNNWLNDHDIVKWINTNRSNLLAESIAGIIRLIYTGLDFNSIVMSWGNGAQRHANLQQIVTYATQFEDYCAKLALLPNVHGFLSWFDSLVEDELDNRGLVTNEFSVNVLTYHAAKGLEWPVVILFDMEHQRDPDVFGIRTKAKATIEFKEPLQDRFLRFWPWPYKTVYGKQHGSDEFKQYGKKADDHDSLVKKEKSEALRLLYVGFTRARDYLIIPFKTGDKDQKCYLKPLVENGISSLVEIGEIETDSILPRSKLFDFPLRLWITSYSYAEKAADNINKQAEIYLQKEKKEYPHYLINPSGSAPAQDITFTESLEIHSAFSDEKMDVERSEFGSFIHRLY
jgi:ATP-dependent exoDNAse (exonuclease V) beta subunit